MFERAMSRVPAAVPLSIVCLFLMMSTRGLADGIELMRRPAMAEASGKVVSVAMDAGTNTGRGSRVFRLEGTFTFAVGGKDYTGSVFGRLPRTSGWRRAEAQQIVQRLSKSGAVSVRYDPANPSSCYAEVADEGSAVSFAEGYTVVTGLLLVVCAAAWMKFAIRCIARGKASTAG